MNLPAGCNLPCAELHVVEHGPAPYMEGSPGAPIMPKLPDDMSAAAVKRRAEITVATKAKPKAAETVAPPKPRIAKKR